MRTSHISLQKSVLNMSKVMRGTKEPNSTSRGGRGQDTHVAESPQPTDGFKGDNYTPKNVRFQTDYRSRNPIPIYCFSESMTSD